MSERERNVSMTSQGFPMWIKFDGDSETYLVIGWEPSEEGPCPVVVSRHGAAWTVDDSDYKIYSPQAPE